MTEFTPGPYMYAALQDYLEEQHSEVKCAECAKLRTESQPCSVDNCPQGKAYCMIVQAERKARGETNDKA